ESEEDQQQSQRSLGDDDEPVAGSKPVGEFNADGCVDKPRNCHRASSDQSNGGIASHRRGHIRAEPSPVGDKSRSEERRVGKERRCEGSTADERKEAERPLEDGMEYQKSDASTDT